MRGAAFSRGGRAAALNLSSSHHNIATDCRLTARSPTHTSPGWPRLPAPAGIPAQLPAGVFPPLSFTNSDPWFSNISQSGTSERSADRRRVHLGPTRAAFPIGKPCGGMRTPSARARRRPRFRERLAGHRGASCFVTESVRRKRRVEALALIARMFGGSSRSLVPTAATTKCASTSARKESPRRCRTGAFGREPVCVGWGAPGGRTVALANARSNSRFRSKGRHLLRRRRRFK
jgi:hypothetical protein